MTYPTIKFRFLSVASALVLTTAAITYTSSIPVFAETEDIPAITITAPSGNETTIASGRSFYVKGTFPESTSIPEGATLTVRVLGEDGSVVRTVFTSIKANKNLDSSYITFSTDTDNIVNSGMPDLIWDGVSSDSFHNGEIKCYYDDNGFAALIAGGKTETSVDDTLGLVDSTGNSYTPLEDGIYTIDTEVTLEDELLLTSSTQITIGNTSDKILARFSPSSHLARVTDFANANNYRVYNDSFPGYWSTDALFAEVAPEWRAADGTEYTSGNVHFIIYNVKETSATYSVELGTLQSTHSIDSRLTSYYYSTGEPTTINNTESEITAFDDGDKLEFVRAEITSSAEDDGVFNQDRTTEPEYDMNVDDGITVDSNEYISLYGVTAPIQLADEDIVSNSDNTYTLNSRITTLHYHITGDNIDQTVDKDVNLNRVSGEYTNPSLLEFKHVIPITDDMYGKTLSVTVSGLDAHKNSVDGTEETFTITVNGEEPTETPNTTTPSTSPSTPIPTPSSTTSPKTADTTPIIPMTVLFAISGTGLVVYFRQKRKKTKEYHL